MNEGATSPNHGIDNQYYNGLLPHTYGTTLKNAIPTPQ